MHHQHLAELGGPIRRNFAGFFTREQPIVGKIHVNIFPRSMVFHRGDMSLLRGIIFESDVEKNSATRFWRFPRCFQIGQDLSILTSDGGFSPTNFAGRPGRKWILVFLCWDFLILLNKPQRIFSQKSIFLQFPKISRKILMNFSNNGDSSDPVSVISRPEMYKILDQNHVKLFILGNYEVISQNIL